MTITNSNNVRNPINKPVLRSMKGSSTILKERNERQPHPGRTNRAGRSGRGRGRGMQSGSSKKERGRPVDKKQQLIHTIKGR